MKAYYQQIPYIFLNSLKNMNLIIVHFKGKRKAISVNRLSFLGKLRGLMFRTRETPNLLFEFGKPKKISLHSWFVFFPFLVLWIDEKNQILEVRKVMPFTTTIMPSKPFRKIVEMPFSRQNKDIISFFVDKEKI